jgi:hypothetical protein
VSVSVSMITFFLVVVAYGADVSARNMRWMHVHGNVLVQLFFLRRFWCSNASKSVLLKLWPLVLIVEMAFFLNIVGWWIGERVVEERCWCFSLGRKKWVERKWKVEVMMWCGATREWGLVVAKRIRLIYWLKIN